jgi:UDP-GlcNAc:undecaprenyl-phosphate/decaprenyl-phosphate GlcNAc-1-phosphate transferase
MSLPVLLIATFAAAAAIAALAGLACAPVAHRLGAVARPRGDRWHQRPIPLLGGLALAIGTLAVVAPMLDAGTPLFVVVAGGAACVVVGLIDDLRPLKPQTKLTAQLLVAAAVVSAGLRLPVTGVIWLDMLLSLLWLVALSNAFNLLDNMDGLAAGVAAIAAIAHLLLFSGTGEVGAARLAAALAGACAGFLLHNFHPARMFMGDAGSLFLGFMVGGLGLVAAAAAPAATPAALLLPALIVLVPIFDTAFVTVHRFAAGRPISQGGRDHASHRLVAAGLSERQAVVALYAAAAVSGLVALATARFGLADSGVAIGLLGVGVILFGVFLGRVGGESASADGAAPRPRLPAASSYGRQAGAFAIDVLLVALAYYAAYRLRFEQTYAAEEPLFVASLPLVVAAKMVAFAMLRTYQGLWRHTSLGDLVRLAQAVVLGEVFAVLGVLAVFRFHNYSRALFVVDAVLLFLFLGGSRVAARLMAEGLRPRPIGRKPIVIYGAGEAGLMVLRELRSNGALGREAVAFVDDDPALARTELHGLRVAGGVDRLDELLRTTAVAEVVVSSTKVASERLAQVREICDAHGVTVVRSVLRFE